MDPRIRIHPKMSWGGEGDGGVNILEDERNRIALLQWSLYVIHTRLDPIHTQLDLIHTRPDLIHTRLDLIHVRILVKGNNIF
jgi:hypothetical protein